MVESGSYTQKVVRDTSNLYDILEQRLIGFDFLIFHFRSTDTASAVCHSVYDRSFRSYIPESKGLMAITDARSRVIRSMPALVTGTRRLTRPIGIAHSSIHFTNSLVPSNGSTIQTHSLVRRVLSSSFSLESHPAQGSRCNGRFLRRCLLLYLPL